MTYEAKVRPWILIVLGVVVIAGGFFTYWNVYRNRGAVTLNVSPTPTVSTAKKSPSASPTTSPSIPADWQTYTNSEYGFSFKYPKDWILSSDNLSSSNATGGRAKLTISKSDNEKIEIIGNFEGGFEDAAYFYSAEISNGKIVVTDRKANEGSANYVALNVLNITQDKWINILFYYPTDNKTDALNIFDQILSTFQFTK